jgi:hypothetical protein
MLVSKSVDIINILTDKYGSPNVITSEVVDALNFGVNEWLNRLLPDSQGGVVNFDMDALTGASLQPLIYKVSGLTTTSGVLTSASINSALTTVVGSSAAFLRVIGGTVDGVMVKYARHNDIYAYQANSFKAPSAAVPYYNWVGSGVQFYPTNDSASVGLTIIKNPKVITTSDLATSWEFPDYTMYSIISFALKVIGISTRDDEVLEDVRLAGLQINQ